MFKALSIALLIWTAAHSLQAATLVNTLKDHPSPYLALHGGDPVHWQSWGPDVLKRAREENKLIYISSGYFSCHWCHVMQRESYGDPGIAALLNRYFIPVKVDRELQPALDEYLIDFVQRTRGSAGWPLNVFLTPEGKPLVGLTYAPPEHFKGLLERVQSAWNSRREELSSAADEAFEEMRKTAKGTEARLPIPSDLTALRKALVDQALNFGDDLEGGFGNQRRFPMAPHLDVLLSLQAEHPSRKLARFLDVTLDQMATQGLRDHLAGGFFRYTVDPGWQTPHYEKMLYTQALLSRVFLRAAQVLERPDYLEVARDTLDFTLKGMRGEEGAFIASLSAVDPQDVEGGAYLWHGDELKRILSRDELVLARNRWRLEGSMVNEGGYLPIIHMTLKEAASAAGIDPERVAALEESARRKLLAAHALRAHPRDTKQLAGWNGLMLSALVAAARELKEPRYEDAARELRDYLVSKLWDGKALHRARNGDRWVGKAAFQDYAYVAAGLADWAVLSGGKEDERLAVTLTQQAWERFFDGNGWRSSDQMLIPGGVSEPTLSDGPLPSPASVLIDLSRRLADRAGNERLSTRVARALAISYPVVARFPFGYPTHAMSLLKASE
ncbi:MAG TPA: thioredoxin domain-containing protein [Chromatiales bacterium]|nr:thioredoxin domain-containing protein [Chromatiales bacterium]